MNGIDIAILVILCGFLLKGFLRGLLKEVCSLAGVFFGALLAFRYHGPLAEGLLKQVDIPTEIAVATAFTVLFLATMIFFLALGYLLSKFVKLMFLGGFNRLIGGVFGLSQGTLLLAVVLFAVSLRPMPWGMDKILKQAYLAPPFVELGDAVIKGSQRILK